MTWYSVGSVITGGCHVESVVGVMTWAQSFENKMSSIVLTAVRGLGESDPSLQS